MYGLSKLRMFEIGVALLLTAAALVFVGWTVWAAEAELRVADAWMRPTVGAGRTTAAYLTVANSGGEDDTLKSARSAKATAVELHETKMTDDGVMQMRHVEDGLVVPAGGSLVLKPAGTHLMVMGLDEALSVGDEFALTLEFARAGIIEVSVPVKASGP